MNKLFDNIDKQIESSKGKNLFYKDINETLRFIPETINALARIGEIDKDAEKLLLDYITNRTIQEFCRVNQYYNFDKKAHKSLRNIYTELFKKLKAKESSMDTVSKNHYHKLTRWLQETNSFAEKIYFSKDEIIEAVACSEYSPDLQIEILQIDISQIIEPVLDIGCGIDGKLVKYFRENGIEAFGFDRFAEDSEFLKNIDWFEFDFGSAHWGTICSNLGFSNHFQHHNLRDDGNFVDYAKIYMDILNSLKVGGSFHYAPGLPFIEKYLDKKKFGIVKMNFGKQGFQSVKITKLK